MLPVVCSLLLFAAWLPASVSPAEARGDYATALVDSSGPERWRLLWLTGAYDELLNVLPPDSDGGRLWRARVHLALADPAAARSCLGTAPPSGRSIAAIEQLVAAGAADSRDLIATAQARYRERGDELPVDERLALARLLIAGQPQSSFDLLLTLAEDQASASLPAVFAALSDLAARCDDLQEALNAAQRGLALAPAHPELRLAAARIALRLGQDDRCRRHLDQVRAINPRLAEAIDLACRLAWADQRPAVIDDLLPAFADGDPRRSAWQWLRRGATSDAPPAADWTRHPDAIDNIVGALLLRHQDQAARNWLALRSPEQWQTATWAGLIAWQEQDPTACRKELERAFAADNFQAAIDAALVALEHLAAATEELPLADGWRLHIDPELGRHWWPVVAGQVAPLLADRPAGLLLLLDEDDCTAALADCWRRLVWPAPALPGGPLAVACGRPGAGRAWWPDLADRLAARAIATAAGYDLPSGLHRSLVRRQRYPDWPPTDELPSATPPSLTDALHDAALPPALGWQLTAPWNAEATKRWRRHSGDAATRYAVAIGLDPATARHAWQTSCTELFQHATGHPATIDTHQAEALLAAEQPSQRQWQILAHHFLQHGNGEQAQRCVAALEPDDPADKATRAWLQARLALLVHRDLGEATRLLIGALEQVTDHRPSLLLGADLAAEQQQWSLALDFLDRVGGDDPILLWRRADILRELGRADEARAAAQRALAIGPEAPQRLHSLAKAAAVAEDWTAVVAYARRILRSRPFDRTAVALLQGAAEALDQDATAVRALAQWLRQTGGDAP